MKDLPTIEIRFRVPLCANVGETLTPSEIREGRGDQVQR